MLLQNHFEYLSSPMKTTRRQQKKTEKGHIVFFLLQKTIKNKLEAKNFGKQGKLLYESMWT
jgi:hypothetical protein